MRNRRDDGAYLIETLIACLIGAVLMMATFGELSGLYKQGAANQNHILATNIAQQLIDNARNSTWQDLSAIADAGGWQDVPLYTVPTASATTLFPRAVLRNPTLTYSDAAYGNQFHGTVRERLTKENTDAGIVIRLQVDLRWKDQRGDGHRYQAETLISETGIHN